MTTGILHIDMGMALGQHEIKYIIEHTGKGYVSLTADMPFLAKLKKPGLKEIEVKPDKETFDKIKKVNELLEVYQQLVQFKHNMPLVIADKPTFELNKIREISKDFNLSIFSNFFSAKAGLDISETFQFLANLTLALQVEKTRNGNLW